MKTISISIFLSLFILNNINGKTTEVFSGNLNSIEVRNSAIVYITEGKQTNVRIEQTDSSESPDIILTTTKNNILIIDSEKSSDNQKQGAIYITIKELKKLSLTGSGSITMINQSSADELSIENSGSGHIQVNINSIVLKIKVSGSGNVAVKGQTKSSNIKLSGSGELDAKELKITECIFSSTGSGSATVDVSKNLNANFTGSGNLYILSYPEHVYSQSDGSGGLVLIKS